MKVLLVLLFLMCSLILWAQKTTPIVDAWEPPVNSAIFKSNIIPPQSIFLDATDYLVSYYQGNVSTNSISRCPFATSCSNFFKKAIDRYGVFGLLLFIDRYYYRENINAYLHYKLIQTSNGVLKLDDNFFLYAK